MGIAVLPPYVNDSNATFTPVGKDIRFGLLAVKNLGKGFIDALVRERQEHGKFQTFYQFCKRMYPIDLNRRALESLILCGAMDGLGEGYNRKQMLSAIPEVLSILEDDKRRNVEGQIGFFDAPGEEEQQGFFIAPMEDLPLSERLAQEKAVAGLYLSGHPMAEYRAVYEDPAITVAARLQTEGDGTCACHDGDVVTMAGVVTAMKSKVTKSNAVMAFLTVEDLSLIHICIFIVCDSGVGKSETAIELVKRGHRLIADDAVEIRRVSAKTLVGSSPANIRHFSEIRGIGIINVANLFGMGAVKPTERIDFIVNLEEWDDTKSYDRMGLNRECTEILGLKIPVLTLSLIHI